jgi:trk system potassium uptake protein
MKKTIGVIGMGRFGTNLSITLEKLGQPVMALNYDEEGINRVRDCVTYFQIVDSTNKEELEKTGVSACETVVVCLGGDPNSSFLTVLNLKEMGIQNIIARAKTDEQGKILQKIGATKVVYPEKESGIRLANQLVSSDILEYIEISPDYQVAEIEAPKSFVGNKVEDLNLAKKYGVLMLALKSKNENIIIPSKQVIEKGNIISIVGKTLDIISFSKKFSNKK